MKLTLIKLSAPGWEKEFDTKDELRKELYSHICQTCRDGDKAYDSDGNLVYEDEPVHERSSIGEMLFSPCGCEFDVEGLSDEENS